MGKLKLEEMVETDQQSFGVVQRLNSCRKEIDSAVFMSMILYQMHWNAPDIEEISGGTLVDPQNSRLDIGSIQTASYHMPNCYKYFKYTCMDGQSVRKQLLDACKSYGYQVKVMVIFNMYRHMEHEYLIAIKNYVEPKKPTKRQLAKEREKIADMIKNVQLDSYKVDHKIMS